MQTVQDAIDAIAEECPVSKDFDQPHGEVIEIGNAEKPEALYITQELALQAFADHALMSLGEYAVGDQGPTIRFVDGPHLDKWAITIQNTQGVHRMAEMRYSVTAKIGIIADEQ